MNGMADFVMLLYYHNSVALLPFKSVWHVDWRALGSQQTVSVLSKDEAILIYADIGPVEPSRPDRLASQCPSHLLNWTTLDNKKLQVVSD